MTNSQTAHVGRIPTGIPSLDEILEGGLVSNRAYLVRGAPGTGKTTLGIHFLAKGAALGERCLLINMGEGKSQIRANAASIGFDLSPISFLDLSPSPEFFKEVQTYDLFTPAEVEREPTTHKIIEQIETLKPQRVFLDAMTHFRYFSTDPFQYRKQVHSFLQFLIEQGATVLFTSEESSAQQDDDLQFMSDGVFHLDQNANGRTIKVTKFRGSGFRGGHHSLRLTSTGMQIFPRLQPDYATPTAGHEVLSSGIPDLDQLLAGGIERSLVTIITGPAGVGKTTLGMVFMKEAAGRGERSTIYAFEEWKETLIKRSTSINIPVAAMLEQGALSIVQVNPLQYNADEFAYLVRQDVEENNTRIVMIDSVAGYSVSLRDENVVSHLHGLCKYLQSRGVTVLLINEIEGITGEFSATEKGLSYLSDNIIFLRFIELKGELRRVIGVLKKRLSDFEKTMREYEITRYGIKVGQPLSNLRGILTGTPMQSDDSHGK